MAVEQDNIMETYLHINCIQIQHRQKNQADNRSFDQSRSQVAQIQCFHEQNDFVDFRDEYEYLREHAQI